MRQIDLNYHIYTGYQNLKKKPYKDTLLDLANVPQSLTKILIGL